MLLVVYTGWLQHCQLKKKEPLQDNAVYNILKHNYDLFMNKVTDERNHNLMNESTILSAIRSVAMKVDISEEQISVWVLCLCQTLP